MDEKFTQFKNKLITEEIDDKSFRVTCLLISYSNNGQAFPSVRHMARILNKSPYTVQKAINYLIDKKIVLKENRTIGTGKKTSNLYKINKKYLVTENYKQKKGEADMFEYDWLGEQ